MMAGMPARDPLKTGAPRAISAVALTAALVATGCASGDSPETGEATSQTERAHSQTAAGDDVSPHAAGPDSSQHRSADRSAEHSLISAIPSLNHTAGVSSPAQQSRLSAPAVQVELPPQIIELAEAMESAHAEAEGSSDSDHSADDSTEEDADEGTEGDTEDDSSESDESEEQAEAENSDAQNLGPGPVQDRGTVDNPETSDDDEAEEDEEEDPTPLAEHPGHDPSLSGGLDEYLEDLTAAYPGEFAVSLRELTGQQRQASVNGSTTTVSASTYKVFVGYSTIRKVEDETYSWDDEVFEDLDLATCFEEMIVVSDNDCPERIGPAIGWEHIFGEAADAGAANSGKGDDAIKSTANDLTTFLTQLQTRQLDMSEEGHDQLLDAMGANVYRDGVPAGSIGEVYDKPGFVGEYLNDAAIVHHPEGTYVLTIMSKDSNWDSVAGITRDVETALYGY